jgi:hypothetical protein
MVHNIVQRILIVAAYNAYIVYSSSQENVYLKCRLDIVNAFRRKVSWKPGVGRPSINQLIM